MHFGFVISVRGPCVCPIVTALSVFFIWLEYMLVLFTVFIVSSFPRLFVLIEVVVGVEEGKMVEIM